MPGGALLRIAAWVSAAALASCSLSPIAPVSPATLPVSGVPSGSVSAARPTDTLGTTSAPTWAPTVTSASPPTDPLTTAASSSLTPSATTAPTSAPSSVPSPSTTRPTPPSTATTNPPTTSARPTSGGTCSLPAALLGKDIERIPGGRPVIALTFDAGAAPDGAERILATLSAKHVPATFFLTGRFTAANPELARRIAASYPVGNHTQTHPDLTELSDAAIRGELEQARETILRLTGQDPRPYFRFPFGAVDRRTIGLVNAQCYVPFRWTVDSLGWKGTSGGMSAAKVYQRVIDVRRRAASCSCTSAATRTTAPPSTRTPCQGSSTSSAPEATSS